MLRQVIGAIYILSIFFCISIQSASTSSINEDTTLIKEIFDPNYYTATYGTYIPKATSPLDHFIQSGWKEGYNPNNWFDIKHYLKFFPQAEDINPVLTWLNGPVGVQEEDQGTGEQLIVSITSHPPRINTAWMSIQSILNQTRKANKIILYLAAADFPEKRLPQSLEILKKKGLEIRFSDANYKVATKLIPALKDFHFAADQTVKTNIVTADDDRCYDPHWLEALWQQHVLHPADIISPAARKYVFQSHEKDLRYSRIDYLAQKIRYNTAGFGIFEGFSGVFYPPTAFNEEVLNFDNFQLLTPCADDVWYQAMAILNNTKSRGLPKKIHAQFQWPGEFDGTQESGLFQMHLNGNDWMAYRVLKYYGILERAGIPVIEDAHCRTCRRKVMPFSSSSTKESTAEDLSLTLVPDGGKKSSRKCNTCFNTNPRKILCIGKSHCGNDYYSKAFQYFLGKDYDVVSAPVIMHHESTSDLSDIQDEEDDFKFDYLVVGGNNILRNSPRKSSIPYYINIARKFKKPYFVISAGIQTENSDCTQEDSVKVSDQFIDLLRKASLVTLKSMNDYLRIQQLLGASVEPKMFVKPDLAYLAQEVFGSCRMPESDICSDKSKTTLLDRKEAIDNINLVRDFIENDEGMGICPLQWSEDERNHFICKLHDTHHAYSIGFLQSMTNTTLFNLLRYWTYQNIADLDQERIRKRTLKPTNNPPVAKHGHASGNENTVICGSLASLVSDADGDTLTYTVDPISKKGGAVKFSVLTKEYTYSPSNPYFTGHDSFIYKVCDGKGGNASAQIEITVKEIGTWGALRKLYTSPKWATGYFTRRAFNWLISWWWPKNPGITCP